MNSSGHRLDFLDGLRGFASLWVVIGHAMVLTGYRVAILAQPDLAVELFIIISGFLMTYHYQSREAREPWDDISTWKIFWVRRFFRIAPLYYICLALALASGPALWADRVAIAQILPDSLTESGRYLDQTLTNIALHLTFLFGMSSTYNFRTPLPDWSIGLEMQFYAVFPFLMLFLKRFGAFLGMAMLLTLAVIIGLNLERLGYVRGAYSILAMKFHLFAAGMLIAASLRARGYQKLLYMLGACIVIFIPLGGGRSDLHRIVKVAMVLGFFLLIYRESLPKTLSWVWRPLNFLLCNRLSQFLGELSYGVYLTHLLVMLPICGWLARSWPALAMGPRFIAALALTVPLTYAVSWACYRYIELPGIEFGRQMASRLRLAQPTLT